MNADKHREQNSDWRIASTTNRLTLLLLLIGHLCCGLVIWFHHDPGLQPWVAVPVINALVTIWLLAGARD